MQPGIGAAETSSIFGGGGVLVIIMQVNGKSLCNSTLRNVERIACVKFLQDSDPTQGNAQGHQQGQNQADCFNYWGG
jgi:hypothetical protein